MHTIFQCAERWELIDKNPIKLVRVKGGTKRLKTPRVLAPEEFYSLLPSIREPYRTMVLIAGCLGLRVSEIVALQWRDFDFPGRTLLIQRSVVHGRVGDVKTEYSRDSVPLDTAVVEALMLHKERCLLDAGGVVVCQSGHEEDRTIRRRFRRSTFVKLVSLPGSAAISAGTRSGTAIGPGWMKPERRSPSKRS